MKIKFGLSTFMMLAPCLIINAAYGSDSQTNLSNLRKDVLKGSSGQVEIGMGSIQQNSDLNSATVLSTRVGFELKKSFNTFSDVDFKASLNLESGSSDSLLNNNIYEPNSGLSLKRAEINLRPFDGFKLSVGAIDLKDFDNDLLLSNSSFLGVAERYTYSSDGFEATVKGLQASPTTKNTSNRLDKVDEGTPSFFLETLGLKKSINSALIGFDLGHFAFDNLSNSVAGESSYFGNSVSLDSSESGEFTYSYIGYTYGLNAIISFQALNLGSYYNVVVNNSAPDENTARRLGLTSMYTKNNSEYSFGIEQFETQADAIVAYYASNIYRSNRIGSVISSKYRDVKSSLELEAKLAQFREIKTNQLEYRDEEQLVYVGVSKAYDF